MFRTSRPAIRSAAVLLAAGMVLPAVVAPAGAAPVRDRSVLARALRRWVAPFPDAARQPGAVRREGSSRRPEVLTLPVAEASLVDANGDGEISTGDMVLANGDVFDSARRRVGTWDATSAHTSDETSMVNLTLRFARFTVTISGAPLPQGSPYYDSSGRRFPAAPIVGSVGSSRYRGAAGFGIDSRDNLVVLLPR